MTLNRKHHLLLAFATITSFLIFLAFSKLVVSWSVMFATPDARTYFDVVEYFQGEPIQYGLEIRPFFYPLIVLCCIKTGGIWMLWIVQLLMWALAAQLIFASIFRTTKSLVLAWLGAVIYLCNYSILAVTYAALSEVTTVFGLAILCYYVLAKERRKNPVSYGAGIVSMLAVLTVVKPVFSIPLYIVTAGFLVVFRKELLSTIRPWLLLTAALIPFFTQLLIFKISFGSWKVSEISNITLNEYLYAQGIAEIESLDYSVIQDSAYLRENQRTAYMTDHFGVYKDIFLQNLDDNLNGEPLFLKYPSRVKSPELAGYMLKFNKYAKRAHLFFFYLSVVFGIYLVYRRRLRFYFALTGLYSLVFYYILVTGISAYQGDRLVLPAIGLWPVVYIVLLHAIFKEIQRRINPL